jgi:3-deoxy-D-manno-octulosonic acid (KDO) 8-phosphate synthase
MTLYATTVVPSLDLLSGVQTIQRLLQSHTEISNVAWDEANQITVAVLETHGPHHCLEAVTETLKQFEVPVIECRGLVHAINKAKELAHTENVVEFESFRVEDSFNI